MLQYTNTGSPHLALDKSDSFENTVLCSGNGNLMRSPNQIARSIVEIIPYLPVPIQRSMTMAVPSDILAPKKPCASLILITNRERIVQPVGKIGIVPRESSLQIDVEVRQVSSVHHC